MREIIEINEENFRQEVLDSSVPVLLQAHGHNCPPCQQIAPVVEKLAEEVAGKAKVVKFEIGEHLYLAVALNILAVPTFVVFRSGQEVARLRGLQPNEALLEALGLE